MKCIFTYSYFLRPNGGTCRRRSKLGAHLFSINCMSKCRELVSGFNYRTALSSLSTKGCIPFLFETDGPLDDGGDWDVIHGDPCQERKPHSRKYGWRREIVLSVHGPMDEVLVASCRSFISSRSPL